jgi:hypothetical protein
MESRGLRSSGVGLAVLCAACAPRPPDDGAAPAAEVSAAATTASTAAAPPAAPAARPAGPTGSIRGTVTLTGTPPEMPMLQRGSDPVCGKTPMRAENVLVDDHGGLANAIVRVAPGTVPAWTPTAAVVVDQRDCMYRPRVQPGVVGQALAIENGDATAHNVNARPLAFVDRVERGALFNRAQPRGAAAITATLEAGIDVVKLKCDMHGWMQGFVVVSDNPYAAVTDAHGGFAIDAVPVGHRALQVWHEHYGLKHVEVDVVEGQAAEVAVAFVAPEPKPGAPAVTGTLHPPE